MKSRTGKWVGSFILQEERKRNRWPRPEMGAGYRFLFGYIHNYCIPNCKNVKFIEEEMMTEGRKGRQTPTRSVVLPYTSTLGGEAIEIYNSTGRTAQEWQELLI